MNPQPAQIFNHGASKFWTRALRIQVLISQDQNPLIFDCPLRRDPEGSRMTNMQQPRRRRRQAPAIACVLSRRFGQRLAHKNILVGITAIYGRVARHTPCLARYTAPCHVAYKSCCINAAELAVLLPYRFRLRQPQRR